MKIQLKRSSVLVSGSAKTPSADQLEYGELAVNFSTTDPSIFMKDSNNQVVRISGENAVGMGQTQVPIVATAPSNPVAGNQYFDTDDNRLYVYTGSAWVRAEPLLTTIADLDVTNTLDISGTANFTSNVGFGVSSPSHALDISNASNAYIRQTQSNSTLRLGPAGTSASDGAFIGTDTTGPLRFYTNGSSNERLRIDTEGRVGINEVSPVGILHVKEGESGVTPNTTHDTLFIENDDDGGITIGSPNNKSGYLAFADPQDNDIAKIQYAHTDNQLSFTVNAGVKAVINSTGNVGINTTSPSRKLEVINDDDYALKVGGTTSGGYYLELGQTGTNGSAGIKYLGSGGSLKFSNVDGEVARFDPDGDFGIGGSPTSTASTKTLQITDSTTARMLLESTGSGGRKYGWYTSVDGQLAVYDYTANAERIRVTSSGNFGINETNPSANLVVRQSGSTFTAQSQTVALFQRSSTTGHGAKIAIVAGNAASSDINFGDTDDEDAGLIQYVHATNSFKFCTASNTTSRLTIDSSGNITIPGNLTVNGSFSQPSGDSSVLNSASVLQVGTTGNFDLELLSNNNKSIVVKNTGLVGIATDSPGKLLSIQDNNAPSLGFYTGSTLRAEFNATSAETSILSYANSPITFNVGGSAEVEAIHINSSGDVGIGASPDAALHVKGGYPTVHIERDHATNYSRLLLDNTANDGGAIDGIGDDTGGMRFSTSVDGTITERLRLGATGNLEFKSTSSSAQQELLFSDGTSGRGRIIYRHDGDSLAFETLSTGAGNNEAMRITSSGNVGIGNSSPGQKLSVLTTGTADRVLNLATTAGANANGDATNSIYFTGGTATRWANAKYEAFSHIFHVNGTEKLTLDSSGRVLIGTTTEGEATADNLTIADSGHCGITLRSGTSSVGTIFFSDGTSGSAEYQGYVQYDHSANYLKWATAGAERMRIDSSGRVGIGANNNTSYDGIAQTLLVADESGNAGITIRSGGSSPYGAIHFADGTNGNAENRAGRIYYQHSVDSMVFSTGNTEALRINSGGHVGIGTDSPGAAVEIYRASIPAIKLNDGGDYQAYMQLAGNDLEIRSSSGQLEFYTGAADGASSTKRLTITNTGNAEFDGAIASAGEIKVQGSSTPTGLSSRISKYGSLLIGTSSDSVGDARLSIDSGNGNINTIGSINLTPSSGTAKLTLGSSSVSGGSYTNYHGASGTKTWFVGSNYNVAGALEFWQSTANGGTTPGSTPAMMIDSSGRVLIGGHTSGNYQLEVRGAGSQGLLVGSTDSNAAQIILDGDSNGDGTGADYASILHSAAGNIEINNRKDAGIIFKTGSSETIRATITSTGNAEFGGDVSVGNVSQIVIKDSGIFLKDTGNASSSNSNLILDTNGSATFGNYTSTTASSAKLWNNNSYGLYVNGLGDSTHRAFAVYKVNSTAGYKASIFHDGSASFASDAQFGTGAADARITIGSHGTAGTNNSVHIRADSANLLFMSGSAGVTKFEQNGTQRLLINDAGNVMIGAGDPSVDLHVKAAATGDHTVRIEGTGASGDTVLNLKGATNDWQIAAPNSASVYGLVFKDITNNRIPLFLNSSGNAEFAGSITTSSLSAQNSTTASWFQTGTVLAGAHYVWAAKNSSSNVWHSGLQTDGDLYLGGDLTSDANIGIRGSDGTGFFGGDAEDRITLDPGSGSYDSDPSVAVIAGKTNNGLEGAFKIRRYDNSNNYTDKVIIDYAGNFGIGNTFVPAGSANNTLGAINKGMLIQGSDSAVGIRLQSSDGNGGIMEMFAENGGFSFDTRGSGFIRFKSSGSEFARIDGSSGYLGVGKDSDITYRITLPEGSGDANRIGWISGSGNRKASIDCGNTDSLVFRTGASENARLTLNSGGNAVFTGQVSADSASGAFQASRTDGGGNHVFRGGTSSSNYTSLITAAGSATFDDGLNAGGIHNGNRKFSVQSTGEATINTESTGSTKVFTVKTGASSTDVAHITADGDASFGGEVKVTTAKEAYKSNGTFTVDNDATTSFNIGYGSLFVITVTNCSEVTNGTSGAFFANTASSTIMEISDPFGDFTANNNVANTTGVTKTAGSNLITIRNDLGASATYAVAIFGTFT